MRVRMAARTVHQIPVGGMPHERPDRNTFIDEPPAAAFLAGSVAQPFEHTGKRHVTPEMRDGGLHLTGLDVTNDLRHLRVQGARALAGSLTITDVFSE